MVFPLPDLVTEVGFLVLEVSNLQPKDSFSKAKNLDAPSSLII